MKKASKNIFEKFEKKWVATTVDYKRVLASSVSLKNLDKKLNKLGDKESVITYVLPRNVVYCPYSR